MRYVRLGKTDLEVSAIAFGTGSFGGEWGEFDTTEATKIIQGALELGITLFDTAQGYGSGAAERVLGDALWDVVRREDVIVATKGGLRPELSGAMTPTTSFAGDDRRSHSSDFTGETFQRNLRVVDRLKRTLSYPAVDVVISGARRPSHLGETVAAADMMLSKQDPLEIDRILADAAPVVGPSPEGM